MTPTNQTIVGHQGNCFVACIASILDLHIDDVPDLNAFESGGEWVGVLNGWLATMGLVYMECTVPSQDADEFFENKDFYHVIIGPTSRGGDLFHAVVGRKGKMVFDPHPGGLYLIDDNYLRIGVFIHSGIRLRNKK